jgi:hypothetical protein
MLKSFILLVLLAALSIPAAAEKKPASPFRDVPADHWASDAVKQMSDSGIVVGYPDGKFKGDKPVTRYELAITLERFVHFVEASRAPLVKDDKKPIPAPPAEKPSLETPKKSGVVQPGKLDSQAKTSLSFLISEGFVPKNSLLASNGAKPVDTELLAQSLTTVVARLVVLEADRQKTAESLVSGD